jgi:hypothetical protein
MPSTSKKQHNFMEAVANNPAFAKKAGVPQSVGKEFAATDKSLQLKGGPRSRPDLQKMNESKTLHGKSQLFKEGGNMATKMNPGFMAMIAKKKAGNGKMAAFEKSGKDVEMKGVKEGSKADMAMDKKQMMMKKGGAAKKMASGGSASARADGIAQKGKTKGKMLAKGGKAC